MGIQNMEACIGVPEVEDEYLTCDSVHFHEHLVQHGLDGKAHRRAWGAAESDMERGNVNVWQKENRGTGAAADFRTDEQFQQL